MFVRDLSENVIADIGHAFGFYDYGAERGLVSAFSEKENAATYIRGYVRMALRGGFLHTTSERQEGFIVYKLPGQKITLSCLWPLLKAVFASMTFGELMHFARCMTKDGVGLKKSFEKAKTPFVYVGMVCVREAYQGQGYMRKVMDIAFAEGDRLQIPVVLETDAKSKCDKYVHLGMQVERTHDMGDLGTLYDLIRYPAPPAQ